MHEDSLQEAPNHSLGSWTRFRGWGLLIATAFAALLLIALAAWALFTMPPANLFTPAISASVSFPLYYPTKTPAGYRIDPKTVQQPDKDVVTFSVTKIGSPTIFISEEATPGKDVLTQFSGQLVRSTTIQTPLGPATYGGLASGNANVASLATGNKTWIIINGANGIPQSSFELLLSSLQH